MRDHQKKKDRRKHYWSYVEKDGGRDGINGDRLERFGFGAGGNYVGDRKADPVNIATLRYTL